VVVQAPAKVNLFLEVLGRRPDGYHDIATLMAAVDLADTLEFSPGPPGPVVLTCDHPGLSVGPDNLVVKAGEALRRRTGHPGGASVRLTKRVPMMAGLGGGSSDAASALRGLNAFWGLGLPPAELAAAAAEVGSDVAFFLGGPAAWCTGRGELVEPETPGGPLDLVIVCPAAGLSTAAVYREAELPASPVSGDAARAALRAGDAVALGRALFNRLEPAAARLEPQVAAWLARLRALDAAGVLMSGSGSSVFALCRDPAHAAGIGDAAIRMAAAGEGSVSPGIFVARSCV
jgi:4-diphosphocytidyl-2-C-methyl-D-erythritol kinase